MSKGPEQLKFEQAVGEKGTEKSRSGDLLLAKQRWHNIAQVLEESADDLELRASSAPAVSDQTGTAMQSAFLKTAASMRDRAKKLTDGAQALGDAATTLHSAEQAKSQLRELHDPGTWTGGTPVTDKELKAKADHDTAVSTYDADRKHNETIAAQHNQAMDAQNEQSTAIMKKVYGYQDPTPEPGAYGSGAATTPGTPGSTSSTPPGGGGTSHSGTPSGGHPGGGTHHGTGGPDGGGTHNGNPTGTPQGDVGAPATDVGATGSGFTPTTPAQSTPGSVGTSFGGVGATIGAGIAGGAGGMFGGVRGGAALPTSGSTNQARSIGSTSRSAGSSTLGRSAAALSAEEEAAGRRASTTARTGGAAGAGRSGGRGSGGRGSSTSGRGGRGAGAGGQASRGRKKSGNAVLDHLIMEEDWLDDEGQSPAVLD